MSLHVALHDPTKATVNHFACGGEDRACLRMTSEEGGQIDIYTTPNVADAIAWIINNPAGDESALEAAE